MPDYAGVSIFSRKNFAKRVDTIFTTAVGFFFFTIGNLTREKKEEKKEREVGSIMHQNRVPTGVLERPND